MKHNTPYERKVKTRNPTVIDFTDDPGLTEQAHAKECDINHKITMYAKGKAIGVSATPGVYMEVPEGFDFQSSMDTAVKLREQFESHSMEVRKRFHNNIQEMIEFLGEEKNQDEAIRLGLVEPPKEPEPESIQKVEVVNKKEGGE